MCIVQSHCVCGPSQRGSCQSITVKALGNQHMRTVCSPCAQSTPITSARHIKPPSITEGQSVRQTVKRSPTEREAKMDGETIICNFTSQYVSSELLPFFIVTQNFPKHRHTLWLQGCALTAPRTPTALDTLKM